MTIIYFSNFFSELWHSFLEQLNIIHSLCRIRIRSSQILHAIFFWFDNAYIFNLKKFDVNNFIFRRFFDVWHSVPWTIADTRYIVARKYRMQNFSDITIPFFFFILWQIYFSDISLAFYFLPCDILSIEAVKWILIIRGHENRVRSLSRIFRIWFCRRLENYQYRYFLTQSLPKSTTTKWLSGSTAIPVGRRNFELCESISVSKLPPPSFSTWIILRPLSLRDATIFPSVSTAIPPYLPFPIKYVNLFYFISIKLF